MFLSTSPPSGKNRLPGLNKFSNSNAYNQLQIVFGKFPGCFCLTGSEIHLPTYVPINIPRRSVSHLNPNHAPVHSPPISLVPSSSQSCTGLAGYQSSLVSITIPFLDPSPKVQPEQVIWCSSFAHLVHKTCEQGQASGLKKISTFWRFAYGSSFPKGSIFSPSLHTPQPHFTLPLLHTRFASFGAHRGVAACFVAHRSLNPHPWLLLPPLIPNKVFASLIHYLKGGNRH